MIRTAVQQIMLGSVTKNEKAAAETLRLIRKAGYDGIELNGFMIRKTPLFVRMLTKAAGMPAGAGGKLDWKALLEDSGLSVIAVHEDLGMIKREPEKVIEEAKRFGTDFVVITGMYRFDYSDPEAVSALSGDLNEYGKILKESGISLLYHNHNAELLKLRGQAETAYERIVEETDPEYLNFELDSYWFTEAGANVPRIMEKLGSRMKLWHVNDRGTRLTGPAMTPILKSDSMELGFGNMDLAALSALAKKNQVHGVILESHRNWAGKSPLESLKLSAKFLLEEFPKGAEDIEAE